MKITQFLSVAAIATTAFTGTLSAVDMTEFNGKNPAQLRAMAGNYKAQALAAVANPYAGSTTDMLVKADAASINAYLTHVAPDVKAAFAAFLTVLNTGATPNDVIFDAAVATGVGGAGGEQAANLQRAELQRAFGAMIDALDNTHAGFGGIGGLASHDLVPIMAQKERVDAGILVAINAWLDVLIPGGALVAPFGGTPNTDLATAGVAADTLAELKATIAAGTIHSAAH
jgi:hypothetical protein